jgi:hypothetical protein
MSAISNFSYVTLVANGGVPVRLADQYGANLPTTGNGSLVFSNGATLTNVVINGTVNVFPLGAPNGTVLAPSLYFGTADRGIFSQGSGDISFAANGVLIASIESNLSAFYFNTNSLQAKLFSDTLNEVVLQSYDTAGVVAKKLTLQKYGANVAIGAAIAIVAGGLATAAGLQFTSTGVLVSAGTGAPTLTAPRGSLYLDNSASYLPYANTNAASTWDQLVGRTATQTLTNKTLTSPTINGGTITGASISGGTLAFGQIVGTSNSNQALAIGPNGAVNPALNVDASAGSLVAGLNVIGAATGGTVSLAAIDAGANTNLSINGKGSGTLLFGNVSTGAITFGNASTPSVTVTPPFILSSTLRYGGVTLTAGVTGTGNMVLDTAPTINNAIVGTQTANDNTTKAASTAYADRVLKNLVIRVTVFTVSGTWTVNANTVYATMEAWGGGGGGGGTATTATTIGAGGGGGGAGSYSRTTSSKTTVGASQVITIGAAGLAGTAGNNAGGAGGDSSVGTLCVGKGGAGGTGNSGAGAANATGGAGGIAGTGDITSTGMAGLSGGASTSGSVTTAGGSSLVGGGGVSPNTISAAGAAGTGRASGGSGGTTFNVSGAFAGGAGTSGYVVITEYCTQ